MPWQMKYIFLTNVVFGIVSFAIFFSYNDYLNKNPNAHETVTAALGFFFLLSVFFAVSAFGTFAVKIWAIKLNYSLSVAGIFVSFMALMASIAFSKVFIALLCLLSLGNCIFVIVLLNAGAFTPSFQFKLFGSKS